MPVCGRPSPPDMVALAECLRARMIKARMKNKNKSPSPKIVLSSKQIMKKKNTGNEQSNQGHRAKMNSSDRSGLIQENIAEGWTQVIGKRDKKKLRKEQKKQEQESAKKDSRSRSTVVSLG